VAGRGAHPGGPPPAGGSDLPVEDIAARCGLGTAANLRLHLARDAGTTPTAYRAAYQGHRPDPRPRP